MQILELPPIPEWLNNAIFLASLLIIIVAAFMLGILQLHQRATTTEQGAVIAGYDVSNHVACVVNYQYPILIVSAIVAFAAGAFIFPSASDNSAKHTPIAEDIKRNTMTIRLNDGVVSQPTLDDKASVKTPGPVDIDENTVTTSTKAEDNHPSLPDRAESGHTSDMSIARRQTPRTPHELMEMVRTKTQRDAMEHKGYWIHVEGSVQDISAVQKGRLGGLPYDFIVLEIAVGSPPYNEFSDAVRLYVAADQWKQQVDTIERGDWLVANGVVEYVSKHFMNVMNGEITFVSGPDGNRRKY